jgi:hypothetical protein
MRLAASFREPINPIPKLDRRIRNHLRVCKMALIPTLSGRCNIAGEPMRKTVFMRGAVLCYSNPCEGANRHNVFLLVFFRTQCPYLARLYPPKNAHVAPRSKTDTIRHPLMRAPLLTATPAFFARLWRNLLGVAYMLHSRADLSPRFCPSLHCSLECSGRNAVQIEHGFL